MTKIHPGKAALSVGLVLGLYHLSWTLLVAVGLAKPFMDFVLRLHSIQMDIEVAPFELTTAATLVALTFGLGATLGLAFALAWNWLSGSNARGSKEANFNQAASRSAR